MKDFQKTLILGVVLLLVGTSFISLVGSFSPEDQIGAINDTEPLDAPSIVIIIDGTMGENQWYVSCVTITITANGDIVYIMYKLDDDTEWTEYTGLFLVTEDGEHIIYAYGIDSGGNQSNAQAEFKIDQTDPTIELTIEKIGNNTWMFYVYAIDETSGVNRVEFYVDGEYLGEVTEAPYEWEYSGTGRVLDVIVYDNAGNFVIREQVPWIMPMVDFTNARTTLDKQVLDDIKIEDTSGCDCEGCKLRIELIPGSGITMIIRNVGDSDCTRVLWSIIFDGGFILLPRGGVRSGVIPRILPGGDEIVSSGQILGIGRTIIRLSVEYDEGSSMTEEHEAFIFLYFIFLNI